MNVLALRGGPAVRELASVGVRRVSTGGALAWAAYGALVGAGRELLESGTSEYTGGRWSVLCASRRSVAEAQSEAESNRRATSSDIRLRSA